MAAKYKLTEGGVKDLETGVSIPNSPGNKDWKAFIQWCEKNSLLDNNDEPEPDLEKLLPILTITELRQQKKSEVNSLRDQYINGGFVYNGFPFQSDPASRESINGIVSNINSGMGLPDGFEFRDSNNVNHAFTEHQMLEMGATLMNFVNNCYKISWMHKAKLDGYDTFQGLYNYDITTDWPSG